MIPDAVLDALVASGCSAEQIAAAVKAANAEDDARKARKREVDAARKRRERERHAMSRGQSVTPMDSADSPSSPEVPPRTPLPNPTNPIPPSPPKGGSSPTPFAAEFENEFWPRYPHRVGKADARAKFAVARRKTELATILDGLERYRCKADDRPWCNPATWLHQERWDDQPAAVVPPARGPQPRAGPAPVITLKDTAANAARRRLEAIENAQRPRETDDHQPPAGFLPYHAERAG